jgi:hypothetical protein
MRVRVDSCASNLYILGRASVGNAVPAAEAQHSGAHLMDTSKRLKAGSIYVNKKKEANPASEISVELTEEHIKKTNGASPTNKSNKANNSPTKNLDPSKERKPVLVLSPKSKNQEPPIVIQDLEELDKAHLSKNKSLSPSRSYI